MFEATGILKKSTNIVRKIKDVDDQPEEVTMVQVVIEFEESALTDDDLVLIARNTGRNIDVQFEGSWKRISVTTGQQATLDKALAR